MTREKEYEFSEAVEEELQVLDSYLQRRRYSAHTIGQYHNYAGLFVEWIQERDTEAGAVHYPLLRDFIMSLKERMSIRQINRVLTAIHHYYDSLDMGMNPVAGLRLRGEHRDLRHPFLDYPELEDVYDSYETIDDRTKRNKVILGLLIYQAITTRELHRLEEKHIDLAGGKIYIGGSRHSNGRTLDLSAKQLLELQEYLYVVRLRMLEAIDTGSVARKPGRKPKKPDVKIYRQLFFSEGGSANIKTSLHHLFRAVKKINAKVVSGQVIRAVVIGHWLKSYDVRKVQYMAGHRFVSSTERYEAFNLEGLEDSLHKYHPLK